MGISNNHFFYPSLKYASLVNFTYSPSSLFHSVNEVFPSALHLPDILQKNNFEPPEDGRKSAFSRAFNSIPPPSSPTDLAQLTLFLANKSFFEYAYTDDKPMGARFGQAMKAVSHSRGYFNLVKIYEPLLSAPKGTILVDIGGGTGHIAIAAAQKFPNLKFVVQDIGGMVNEGRDGLPEELKDRVEFQENDFFKGQPIGGPGVYYYLRHILHDHPDPWVFIASGFLGQVILTGGNPVPAGRSYRTLRMQWTRALKSLLMSPSWMNVWVLRVTGGG